MADRLQSFSVNTQLASVFLNAQQDLSMVLRVATATSLATQDPGVEGRIYQATSDLNTGTLISLDNGTISVVNTGVTPATLTTTTMSWSDREVFGIYRGFAGAAQYPGGANDYQFDAAGAPTLFYGYLGLGAKTGASAQVSAGNPPVPAAGTSWAIQIVANLWLYRDPFDGLLKLYNATGSTIRTPALIFFATGPTGAR
jgi:hypothetical protein